MKSRGSPHDSHQHVPGGLLHSLCPKLPPEDPHHPGPCPGRRSHMIARPPWLLVPRLRPGRRALCPHSDAGSETCVPCDMPSGMVLGQATPKLSVQLVSDELSLGLRTACVGWLSCLHRQTLVLRTLGKAMPRRQTLLAFVRTASGAWIVSRAGTCLVVPRETYLYTSLVQVFGATLAGPLSEGNAVRSSRHLWVFLSALAGTSGLTA
eukprot:6492104-Amphidinium_carterae.1